MNHPKEIIRLSDNKLKEAKCLLSNDFADGAFYLAGYAIELLLKAKVCRILCVDDFYMFKALTNKDHYRPFKIHDLEQLAVLAGINAKLLEAKKTPSSIEIGR
jgi:HEPN domain-containing protein